MGITTESLRAMAVLAWQSFRSRAIASRSFPNSDTQSAVLFGRFQGDSETLSRLRKMQNESYSRKLDFVRRGS